MKRKIIAAIVTASAIFGLSLGSAFAWTYSLSGHGDCQNDGTFKISWTVNNTAENEALHITASSNTSVVPVGTDVAAGHSQGFTQTVSGGAAASFSLTLTGNFASDQTLRERTATVNLSEPCEQSGGGQGGGADVTLCHATDSRTNPYVKITVDASGAYHGHYSQHTGPVFSSTVSGRWGDIIPPFVYNDHTYSLNWDSSGQAIFNNGCKVGGMGGGGNTVDCDNNTDNSPASECQPPSGGLGGGGVTTGTTTTTTTVATNTTTTPTGGLGSGVATTPSSGVNAGGGAEVLNIGSLAGLLASTGGLGFGLRRVKRSV